MKTFIDLIIDAFAFITNPDARKVSEFKFPSGNYMSVRDAKKRKLL